MHQLSLFDNLLPDAVTAICCMDMMEVKAEKPEGWMLSLVPDGEYTVDVGGHPLVLRPTRLKAGSVPKGHEYYHYRIGERIYAGMFVGRTCQ